MVSAIEKKIDELVKRAASKKEFKKIRDLVLETVKLGMSAVRLSKAGLILETARLKKEIQKKELDEILPKAFALVWEATFRALKQEPFLNQIAAGIFLHHGKAVELASGEGKTLAIIMPAFLNALSGKGVHIVTANDYLAKRDYLWMDPVFRNLGVTVGLVTPAMPPPIRKRNYQREITYVASKEIGFDYLRDSLVSYPERKVLRPFNYATVDELDSILIDEARTPLIITAPQKEPSEKEIIIKAKEAVDNLRENEDYDVDKKHRLVSLTEKGIKKLENMFEGSVYEKDPQALLERIDDALKAKVIFKKDVDYVVLNNKIILVDEYTGRFLANRRLLEKLQQAIEAKEKIPIQPETKIAASITFQNFFKLYPKLSGLSATILDSAKELKEIYKLETVAVPTNKPVARVELPVRFYLNEEEKFKSVAKIIAAFHRKNKAVLTTTRSIVKARKLAQILSENDLPYQIIHAKYADKEPQIVKEAGKPGMITIATNMAGRGTDIILDPLVVANKGLHVIATEVHESKRIDKQLMGRAGRQGQPGLAQFHLSLDDEIFQNFGSSQDWKKILKYYQKNNNLPPIWWLRKFLEKSQAAAESSNFEQRKYLYQFDEILEKQRQLVYDFRNSILHGFDLRKEVNKLLEDEVKKTVEDFKKGAKVILSEDLFSAIKEIIPLPATIQKELQYVEQPKILIERFCEIGKNHIKGVNKLLGQMAFQFLGKPQSLKIVNNLWAQHLEEIQNLQKSIRFLSFGQQEPLTIYIDKGHQIFEKLKRNLRKQIIKLVSYELPQAFMLTATLLPQLLNKSPIKK